MSPRARAAAATALLGALIAACGPRGDVPSGEAVHGFPAPPSVPYEVTDVTSGGMVAGTVWLDRQVPRDTVVRPTSDEAVCGRGEAVQTISVQDGRLAGAIVWLSDIRAGKRLPIERLYEIRHVGCRLAPRVQAVLTGGTLNVRSADPISHHTRFVHTHTGDTVAVVRQTDAGSVVPVQTVVARPGLLRLSCDVHPWTTGWLAVFDHPYVAMTGIDGQFFLPEVPAGRYTLVVWHERLGSETREVVVPAGRTSVVEIRY